MGGGRKRSAAVTLVLAGSLSGCGEPQTQHDVYAKLEDCTKDWGNPAECSQVTDGRHSSTYFYGPRYYGSSFPSGRPRPSPNALEATPAGRGGATHMAGSGSRDSLASSRVGTPGSVSRGGFGSSARSMSSGG
ncbi:MAG: hypothetical protein ABI630_04160 [Betaproteobacteria bacterium]